MNSLALGRQHDDGFDRFAEAFDAVRRRTVAWAVSLRDSADR